MDKSAPHKMRRRQKTGGGFVDLREAVKKGNKFLKREDYEKALEYYREATAIRPKNTGICLKIGDTLSKIKEDEKALEAYDKVIRIKPECTRAWYKRGKILSSLKRYEEALKAYDKVIRIKPRYFQAHYEKGKILSSLKRYEEALKAYDKVIRICGDRSALSTTDKIKVMCARAWYKKGDILGNLEKEEEALAAYEESVEFYNGIDKEYNVKIAEMRKKAVFKLEKHKKLKEYRMKLEEYEKSKQHKEFFFGEIEYASIWHDISTIFYDLKRYEDELKANEEIIRIYEKSEAYEELKMTLGRKGSILFNLKEYGKALETYEKMTEKYPKCSDVWYNKGDLLRRFGRYKDAIEAYDKCIEIDPTDVDAIVSKGYVLYNIKRYKEALDAFEKAIEIDPKHVIALNNTGDVLCKFGKFERALHLFKKAIEIKPGYAFPYISIAEVSLIHGDLTNASYYADRAININEKAAYVWFLKGKIEIEKRNYDCAIKFFEKAIYLDSNDIRPLLWISYTRYLKVEAFNGNRRNKEEIFAIIRELERMHDLSGKHSQRELRECILYFLGYFYYRNIDIFTAKERLEECIKLESRRVKVWEALASGSVRDELRKFYRSSSKREKVEKIKRFVTAKSTTEQRARELLNHIWKYKLKPAWWRWWWSSPVHKWSKRFIFVLLLFPVLSFLFYVLMPESIHISRENLFVYILLVPASIPSIKENLDVYIAMISISVFFLLLPTMEKIKVKEIDVEMSSPPSFEPFISPYILVDDPRDHK